MLHDEPEGFERAGAAIVSCQCCHPSGNSPEGDKEHKRKLTPEQREKLEVARELGEIAGDDVDGYAAELEDLEQYFAQRQVEEASDRELLAYSDGTLRRADEDAEERLDLRELGRVRALAEVSTFPLGQIVATRAAFEAISASEILQTLSRHSRGDWGDVDDVDRQANDQALREGSRLLSVYHTKGGAKFWVITEADRSTTTVLLPENY